MSSVVPEGTAMLLRTMVAQDVLDLLAEAALVKVHEVARSLSFAAIVGIGAAAGTATARPTLAPASMAVIPRACIVMCKSSQGRYIFCCKGRERKTM